MAYNNQSLRTRYDRKGVCFAHERMCSGTRKVGDLSFISSPHYHLNKDLKTADEMAKREGHFTKDPALGFSAARGIGQGESASSLLWTALCDILLDWLDPTQRHLHTAERLEYTEEDAAGVKLNAYADDLATLSSGGNAEYMQQLIATWLSAFCAFTGLVLHPAKICPTLLGIIPEKYTKPHPFGPREYENKTDLVVHDF